MSDIITAIESDAAAKARYEHLAGCAECRALARCGAQNRTGIGATISDRKRRP